jgi:hypothetical protein
MRHTKDIWKQGCNLREFVNLETEKSFLCLHFLSAAILYFFWREHRHHLNGLGWWMLSYLVQVMATFLVAGRDPIPDFLSIVVGNSILIFASLCLLIGLERYLSLPVRIPEKTVSKFWIGLLPGKG